MDSPRIEPNVVERSKTWSLLASVLFLTLSLYGLAHLWMLKDQSNTQQERAVLIARALSWVAGQDMAVSETEASTRFLEALLASDKGVERALVTKGLRKYYVHSDPSLAGARIRDKELYDRANRVKSLVKANVEERSKQALEQDPFPSVKVSTDNDRITVQLPVVVEEQFKGLTEVTLTYTPSKAPFPLLIVVVAAAGLLLGGLVLMRLQGQVAAIIGAMTVALMGYAQVDRAEQWHASLQASRAVQQAHAATDLFEMGLSEPSDAAMAWLNTDARGRQTQRLQPPASAPGPIEVDSAGLKAHTAETSLGGWGLIIASLAVGLFLLGTLGQAERAARSFVSHIQAYAYISPAMLGLLILVFVPVTYGLALGFYARVYNQYEFVGLSNYLELLSSWDITNPKNFYFTLAVTVLWTVTNVTLAVSIGLFLALLLNDEMLKAKGIYRVILVVPWAIPNYVTALIWKSMFHKQFGAINAFLNLLGFESMSWFQSFVPAFTANLSTNTWLGFPFMMVVSLGALQSIPTDLYEAARVDGASRWQRFYNITWPLLMPALVPAVIVGTVWTFNMFNIIYLVSGGAPNGATDILITEAYRWGFEADRKGFAAAYSTVIFLILFAFTVTTNRITGATKGAFE